MCPVCKEIDTEDTQEHLLNCPKLCTDEIVENNPPNYQDLFKDDTKRQLQVATIMNTKFRKRKKMMKITSQPEKPSEPLGCSTV